MAAAVALWGGWGCLRVWEGYFRGPGQSTLTAEAVTVLRPARLGGGGAAVTTVRPPAPPTAPGPPKHWSAQTRPGLRKAHALTRQLQYAQAQLEALAPATNLTLPGTVWEGFGADQGACG